jgi:hypothetical protein
VIVADSDPLPALGEREIGVGFEIERYHRFVLSGVYKHNTVILGVFQYC